MYDELSGLSAGAGLDDFGATNFEEMNRGVTPVFIREPVKNDQKTKAEGRPIFDEMEIVRLFVAGDQYNQVSHPVDDRIKERFAKQYREWKERGTDRHISGTPLRQWPLLTVANVAEFEALNVFNVEGLATLPDSALQRSFGLREWRAKAQAYLEAAKGGAAAAALAEENLAMKDEIASMREEMKRLSAIVEHNDGKSAKAK